MDKFAMQHEWLTQTDSYFDSVIKLIMFTEQRLVNCPTSSRTNRSSAPNEILLDRKEMREQRATNLNTITSLGYFSSEWGLYNLVFGNASLTLCFVQELVCFDIFSTQREN